MVASPVEAVVETQETQPEVAPPTQPEVGTETVVEPVAQEPDAHLQGFLRDNGFEDATQTDTGQDSGVSGQNLENDGVPPEVRERIAREVLQSNQQAMQEAGVYQSFATRTTAIRTALRDIQTGKLDLTPAVEDWFAEQFNQHHAQSGTIHQRQAAEQWTNTFYQEAEKHAPGITKAGHKSTAEALNAVVDGARKGYVPEKAIKGQIAKVLSDYETSLTPDVLRRKLSKAGEVPSEAGASGSSGNTALTLDRALTIDIKEAQAMRDRARNAGR